MMRGGVSSLVQAVYDHAYQWAMAEGEMWLVAVGALLRMTA